MTDIAPTHPIFGVILGYAFSRAELNALSVLNGASNLDAGMGFQDALVAAAMNGWVEIMDTLATSCTPLDFDAALGAAASRGQVGAMLAAIGQGATNIHVALVNAAGGGFVAAVQVAIDKCSGAINWQDVYVGAGSMDIEEQTLLEFKKGVVCFNEALDAAAAGGHVEAARAVLVTRGADRLDSALECAAAGGHVAVMQLLVEMKAGDFSEALAGAARGGKIDAVEMLLRAGAGAFDYALFEASSAGNVDVMRVLIEAGAAELNRPLCQAAVFGHAGAVRLLLDCKATDVAEARKRAVRGMCDAVVKVLDG